MLNAYMGLDGSRRGSYVALRIIIGVVWSTGILMAVIIGFISIFVVKNSKKNKHLVENFIG